MSAKAKGEQPVERLLDFCRGAFRRLKANAERIHEARQHLDAHQREIDLATANGGDVANARQDLDEARRQLQSLEIRRRGLTEVALLSALKLRLRLLSCAESACDVFSQARELEQQLFGPIMA